MHACTLASMPALILAKMQQYPKLANEYEHSLRSLNLLKAVLAAQLSKSPKLRLFSICILAGKSIAQ